MEPFINSELYTQTYKKMIYGLIADKPAQMEDIEKLLEAMDEYLKSS